MDKEMVLDLDAIDARDRARTQGAFVVEIDRNEQANLYSEEGHEWIAVFPHQCIAATAEQRAKDAAFFQGASVDIPALCREVRVLRGIPRPVDLPDDVESLKRIIRGMDVEVSGAIADYDKARLDLETLSAAAAAVVSSIDDENVACSAVSIDALRALVPGSIETLVGDSDTEKFEPYNCARCGSRCPCCSDGQQHTLGAAR